MDAAAPPESSASAETSRPPRELWRSSEPDKTFMHEFSSLISTTYHLDLADYSSLYDWSISDIGRFWEEVWHFTAIKSSQPFQKVATSMHQPPKKAWDRSLMDSGP